MSKWELVRLGDIFKITSGGTPLKSKNEFYDNGTIPWVKTGDLKQKYLMAGFDMITEAGLGNSSAKLFPKGTVLIAMYGATIGACSILGIEASTNQACAAFLPNEKVNHSYLYYFLVSQKEKLIKMGVGGAQPNISATILKTIEMPLPPIDVQKHIVGILDKAQEITDGHKKQLQELDNLIKASFYDMFGDPFINDKGWGKEKLLDVCDKITDGTHDTPPRVEQGVLFITGKNIRPFYVDLTDIEFVSQKDHDVIYKRCNPEFKDVLYTNIGVNYGTAAINLFDYEFSMKNVALLKYKRNILTGEYLQCYLNYKREYIIDQNKTGGAQTFMGLATIKQLDIHIPPFNLQNKFTEIVTIIEEQKAIVKKSIAESETLFNCLMSKYFD